ncbi:Coenzyme PQQ synthesis protein D (PqqD) [Yoonia tamlensis]|uniref:Coenzyme PQQ synthesis protein D (PqqD) n=1 Tax=Yoonia tamlensis TaxID=390270 RepID=A0A1I6FSQ9_9RHOB|nr:PqqD family protein [Yoonia tamlensis]SFR32979.1 Coenzyme PQQ synthesis protein D (PqqD) [Yoonia tamlensis]
MTETVFLHFEGLAHPVALTDAAALMPIIADVLAGWPYRTSHHSTISAFVCLRPLAAGQWELQLAQTGAKPRIWDAVNAICDLLAEMAWERLRSDPALLCLHAAAVAFSGRLVVFPDVRRAGKSTLAVALGRQGHQLFTDDYLPMRITPDTHEFSGIANGAIARVRLPLPESFSAGFIDWVTKDAGPSNDQYKYICGTPIAAHGTTMPMGAMVVLDRSESEVAPQLAPISREDALTRLITQNFARTQLSGDILATLGALVADLPVFRLTYHCAEQAAAYLSGHSAFDGLPAAVSTRLPTQASRAPLDRQQQPAPEFMPAARYMQAQAVTATQVGEDHFLADGNGLAIFRMNAGSVAIWRVLAKPASLAEIIEILTAAFVDADPVQIASDCETLLRQLVAARLVVPHSARARAS